VGQSVRIGEKREGDDGVVEFVGTKGGVGGGGVGGRQDARPVEAAVSGGRAVVVSLYCAWR
jgi:hypothetical protein